MSGASELHDLGKRAIEQRDMKCPVCPNTDIRAGQTSCGNCGADLTAIRRLEELPARWYNEALELLRKGQPEKAIAKLEAAVAVNASTPVRRLLGKALWNAGRPEEAIAQWQMLPDDEEAKRLLAMPPPQTAAGRPAVGLVAGAIALAIALGAGVILLTTRRAVPIAAAPVMQANAAADPLAASPTSADPDPSKPSAVASIASRLSGRSGLRTTDEHGAVAITFDEGLFASGSDAPTRAGAATLKSLARVIAAEPHALEVMVEGFTDAKPPPRDRWSDNWSLAFSRAHAAVRLMRPESGTRVSWSAKSAGDQNTPYPNETEADRARNRTVVLHVSAALEE